MIFSIKYSQLGDLRIEEYDCKKEKNRSLIARLGENGDGGYSQRSFTNDTNIG